MFTKMFIRGCHNQLETLLFLKDFKDLKILNLTENRLHNHERYLSLYLCSTIEHLIDLNEEQIHNDQLKLKQLLEFIETNMQHLCSLLYHDKDKHFRQSIIKIIENEQQFSQFHLSTIGKYLIEKMIDEFCSKSKQSFKTYLTDDFNHSVNIYEDKKILFEPIKFLHCHHHSNDDMTTIPIQMCAFEPNTSNNILATCGGRKVCFINCDTCEITHLFEVDTLRSIKISKLKDKNRIKNIEHFSCLCWIEIEYNNENLKILAVGATNGHIYLLSPKWKLMFGHIELLVSS